MVVFTCNHCGESLQKPKVEKHYFTQCRTAKSLTCVDCHKDFKNEEYATHIKCITEEERYAAKGTYVGGIVKKGEAKQESWTDMIKAIVEKEAPNLKPSVRNLLNTIAGFTNVPRKKAKFINFLKNSQGGRLNFNDVEETWNIIENHKNSQPKPTKNGEAHANGDSKKSNDNIANGEGSINGNAVHENGAEKKKKKEKRKAETKDEVENNDNIANDEGSTNSNAVHQNGAEKKKKEKRKAEATDEVEQPVEKKKKKEAIKTPSEENGLNEKNKKKEDIKTPSEENGLNEDKKKKKKKSKKTASDENNINENKKNETLKPCSCSPSQENNVNEVKEVLSETVGIITGDEKVFSFKEKILAVLRSKGTVSCSKLQKRIMKAYQKEMGTSWTEKTIKKYNKKLKKLPGVKISDDVVTLMEASNGAA